MWDFFKERATTITAILLGLMLTGMLSMRLEKPEIGEVVETGLQNTVSPIQQSYQKTTGHINSIWDDYIALVGLRQENQNLRNQISALQEELNLHINSSIQFNLLREQLKFQEEDPRPKVFAEVVGESLDNFHHTLLINKGARDGIRRNYPVVLREGVVGRVQAVSDDQAMVELITDRRHRFQVIIQRTRERAIVRGAENGLDLSAEDKGLVMGMGGNEMQVGRIRMLADVQKGDRVVTSGLGGIFPKGLLVGTITNVYHESHELFQTAEVAGAVDFSKIEGVFVMLKDPRDQNLPLFTQQ